MKISAFPIYRFFRNGLPAMTGAGSAGVLFFCVMAFVVFSPGFSFTRFENEAAKVPAVAVSDAPTEIGALRDSEPLFLPTRWNFGANVVPEELDLRESSFLPFGGIFFLGMDAEAMATLLKNAQNPPTVEDALGVDAWKITRGFGAEPIVPTVAKTAGTAVKIVNASTGTKIFEGELSGVEEDGESELLLSPSEFICGIASGFGSPSVIAVRSSGNSERDKRAAAAVSKLLHALSPERGLYRIFVD